MRRAICWLKGRAEFPHHEVLKPPSKSLEWIVYFIFAPSGRIDEGHQYTIDKLRRSRRSLLVVFASESSDVIDPDLADQCEALIWKDLPGYDFSGYALGLNVLARALPGASALVLNDSVFGPFYDLDPLLDGAKWDLTGFSASESQENHIQSFAFYLKRLDQGVIDGMGQIFSLRFSFDDFLQTVTLRETRMARLAAKSMTVGSFLYAPNRYSPDPTVEKPLEMIDCGFPFLKRSLLGKHHGKVAHLELVRCLMEAGHPPSDQRS